MDFLKQLQKTAKNVAIERLEKLGVNVPQYDIPDDEDTKTRDFFDIYREISEKNRSPEPIPISEALRDKMIQEINPICGQNTVLQQSLNAWISEHQDTSYEHLKQEAIHRLQQGGVIRSFGENPEQWLENLQSIAQAQQRTVFNLLIQAHKQCNKENISTWIHEMNERLSPFDLAIESIETQKITLVDC